MTREEVRGDGVKREESKPADDGEIVDFDWMRAGPVGEVPEMMNMAWVGIAAS